MNDVFENNKRVNFTVAFLVLFLLSLNFIHIVYFQRIDAPFSSHIAERFLDGQWGIDFYGDLAGYSDYFLGRPPLHALFVAASFKVFGISYKTATITSLLFSICTIFFCYRYLRGKLPDILILIVIALISLDPSFFGRSGSERPEMTLLFFYTIAALLYKSGEEKESLRLIVLSGVITGIAFMTYFNALWVIMSIALYKIVSKTALRDWKIIGCYVASFAVIILPYWLWIVVDDTRLALLIEQLSLNSSSPDNSFSFLTVKKLLNPVADLYILMFRYYSIYPVIFLSTMVFFIMNFKKYNYLFCMLIVPFLMMMVNIRSGYYLIVTIPLCYMSFGYMLRDMMEDNKYRVWVNKYKTIFVSFLALILIFDAGMNMKYAIAKPSLVVNIDYYRNILEKYTEKKSRVVTDSALMLSASEGRTIIEIAPLIWERWRYIYSYDKLFKGVNPDYIILTERKKKWGETGEQSKAFQELLKTHFVLTKLISDETYGKLWIYKRVRENI